MRHAVLAALLAITAACGQGDRKTCESACRNYVTLSFWNKWDPLINAEPEAQRPKLRRDKLAELEAIIASGVDQCVESCVRADNEDQYKCMVKAKTYKEVHACAETEAEAQ
jgi:hypothetical protein